MPTGPANASRATVFRRPGRACAHRHSRRIFNPFSIGLPVNGHGSGGPSRRTFCFLRVSTRTLGSYRVGATRVFATWVTSVTRNLLNRHYRRTKRDRVTDRVGRCDAVVENKESSARRAGRKQATAGVS